MHTDPPRFDTILMYINTLYCSLYTVMVFMYVAISIVTECAADGVGLDAYGIRTVPH